MDLTDSRTLTALAMFSTIYAIYRLIHAMRYPMVDCRRCRGSGRRRSRKFSDTCPVCQGAARRLRLAAKVADILVPFYNAPD